jgi:hypothetical protein
MDKKYLAKIIATDNEGLQMISACSAGAKVKVSDIKYLSNLIKFFYYQLKELKLKLIKKIKKLIVFVGLILLIK